MGRERGPSEDYGSIEHLRWLWDMMDEYNLPWPILVRISRKFHQRWGDYRWNNGLLGTRDVINLWVSLTGEEDHDE